VCNCLPYLRIVLSRPASSPYFGEGIVEIYKFYINALYVAITRAVENLYLIEANPSQRLFELLGLTGWEGPLDLAEHGSSLEEWRQEARKLELQGKQEQADEIRTQILKLKPVPWEVLKGETLNALEQRTFTKQDKQAKLLLFEYALVYQDRQRLNALAQTGFPTSQTPRQGDQVPHPEVFLSYELKNLMPCSARSSGTASISATRSTKRR